MRDLLELLKEHKTIKLFPSNDWRGHIELRYHEQTNLAGIPICEAVSWYFRDDNGTEFSNAISIDEPFWFNHLLSTLPVADWRP